MARLRKIKCCLILDKERYRYQKFCSDISGQDIKAHQDDVDTVIKVVRNWLRANIKSSDIRVPGAKKMAERYQFFLEELPAMCEKLDLEVGDVIFNEYTTLVVGWLDENKWYST